MSPAKPESTVEVRLQIHDEEIAALRSGHAVVVRELDRLSRDIGQWPNDTLQIQGSGLMRALAEFMEAEQTRHSDLKASIDELLAERTALRDRPKRIKDRLSVAVMIASLISVLISAGSLATTWHVRSNSPQPQRISP
jgi:hypothetical protein